MHPAKTHKDVTALEKDGRLIVRISTPITVPEAEPIHAAILSEWDEHPDAKAVIVDLSAVPRIDSSGMGILMDLANRAEKCGIPLRICGVQEAPLAMLRRMHLDRMLPVYADVKEASRDVPRRRERIDDGQRTHGSHRLLWAVTILILTVLIAGGAYGYLALGAYRGKMNLLPQIQAGLVSAGSRIDATENSMRNWVAERDQWSKRAEAKIDGAVHAVRQQAKQITSGNQQLRAEIDQRASSLQTQIDSLSASQQATGQRVSNLEQQVRELQESRVQQPAADQPPASGTAAPDRKDFDLGFHSEKEIAPGVWIRFSGADVPRQRFDGRLWLLPERRAIGIRSHSIGQPLLFSRQGDDKTAQLVVTRVSREGIAGYLLLPRQNAVVTTAPAE